jgi:ferredoxin
MKVRVDLDLCEGNALCVRAAPEVFRVTEDDYVELLTAEPPEELRLQVKEAVRRCPRGALSLMD